MKFDFRFESLLRYRRSLRDECQRALGEVIARRETLQQQRHQIQNQLGEQSEQLRQIGLEAVLNVDGARSRQYYRTVLESELAAVHKQQDLAGHQLNRARQALVEADRQVQVLEKLKERQLQEYTEHTRRYEQRDLEDIWQGTHQTKEPK